MITLHSTYITAMIRTDDLEPSAEGQIRALCDQFACLLLKKQHQECIFRCRTIWRS